MRAPTYETTHKDDPALLQLDVYSRDGQFIGRVGRYLPLVPESEDAIEIGSVDLTDSEGRLIGERHVVIDGAGTIIQSYPIVPVDLLDVDLRGRRVTVPLTVADIEAMPRFDPNRRVVDPLL